MGLVKSPKPGMGMGTPTGSEFKRNRNESYFRVA